MREVGLDVLAAELAHGAFVIDVREPYEYTADHVPGAPSTPLSAPGTVLGELPGDRPVHVICASGNRSARPAEHLTVFGVDAVSVAGGTAGRARTARPLVRGTAVHGA
ncbi:rhodanese-like domain-containing protein [Streptomyces sp. NPDC001732]